MYINEKNISRLCLGTAGFGGGVDEDTSFRLIDTYLSLGGNTLDTARVYGNSEATLGKYLSLRRCRENIILATKGAHYDTVTKQKRVSARDIEYDVELSLKNLKTDTALSDEMSVFLKSCLIHCFVSLHCKNLCFVIFFAIFGALYCF